MLPAYFISHGAPDIVLRDTPAAQFLRELPLPDCRAIVVISAHWMTEHPRVMAAPSPSTIHDFGGFPEPLYRLRYPAKGDPELAQEILDILQPDYPDAALDPQRGYDHGAWMPLLMIRPQADIPVIQLSIQPNRDAQYHYDLGKQLAVLRERGVLMMASGSITHNLRAVFSGPYSETPKQVTAFNEWIHGAITMRDDASLLKWQAAPGAAWNHPSPDHILPLFTVLGATTAETQATCIHRSLDYEALSMDSYRL